MPLYSPSSSTLSTRSVRAGCSGRFGASSLLSRRSRISICRAAHRRICLRQNRSSDVERDFNSELIDAFHAAINSRPTSHCLMGFVVGTDDRQDLQTGRVP